MTEAQVTRLMARFMQGYRVELDKNIEEEVRSAVHNATMNFFNSRSSDELNKLIVKAVRDKVEVEVKVKG